MRSLFIRITPPQGIELHRREVPELFALIDELRQALSSLPIHHVILTSDFNAAASQVPLFGLFGWQQNYLILGLPLLQSLSTEQFRAVLAHEFGHLSGNHSRFSAWIYRMRWTWISIVTRLQQSESAASSFLFNRFFIWYYPFFNAYSFVLARSNEYEADRCAAELTGSKNIAEALINVEVKAPFIEQSFWQKIYQQANEQPEPPATPFTNLATAVNQIEAQTQQKFLNLAIARKTNNSDTHPCLTERLTALGYPLQSLSLPSSFSQSAAQKYLGKSLAKLTATLEQEWQNQINYKWRERHTYAQQIRQSLTEIEQKVATTNLTIEETWNCANWTRELNGIEAAIPLLYNVLKLQSDHVSANYLLGEALLYQGDAAGIQYLETAMNKDFQIVVEGCQMIYNFLQQQGQETEAQKYYQRADNHYQLLLEAEQERSGVWQNDQFTPHDLSVAQEQAFRQKLAQYVQIKEAYLVKKAVKYFPQKPFYVLIIQRQKNFWELDANAKNQELLNLLLSQIDFADYIIVSTDFHNNFMQKIRQTAKVAIYS
jgi:Zn-dependent protease with chaperone function